MVLRGQAITLNDRVFSYEWSLNVYSPMEATKRRVNRRRANAAQPMRAADSLRVTFPDLPSGK